MSKKEPKNKNRIRTRVSGKRVEYDASFPAELPYIAYQHGKLTDKIAACHFGCSQSTIEKWKRKRPEFRKAFDNPLGGLVSKHAKVTFENALSGRIERNAEGDIIKRIAPTHNDLKAPVDMGYLDTAKYTRNLKKDELKDERLEMQRYIQRYYDDKLNLSELLTQYHIRAIDPPEHLIKEHSHATTSNTLEIIEEIDTYDQAHAAKILAAKQEREQLRIQQAIEDGIKNKLAEAREQGRIEALEQLQPTPEALEQLQPTPEALEQLQPTPEALEQLQPQQDIPWWNK